MISAEPAADQPAAERPEGKPEGKRVSWVELYFDLIFAFAVGETTHIMVSVPGWAGFGTALGLFFPLWWAWVGFVVLYNRHMADQVSQRLFVLAGTLPLAVAAVETHDAADGHGIAFALALAATRLILALAFAFTSDQAKQVSIGYGAATVLFAASAWVPSPWRYLLWGFALIQEAGFLLLRSSEHDDRKSARHRDPSRNHTTRDHNPRDHGEARPTRTEKMLAAFRPPADPTRGVDAAHLSERFGLMIIILLGEVVVSVGESAVEVADHDPRYWLGLLAGLVLAAALWWMYFTASAPLNEYVLRASGGNPTMAYGIYAGGHLSPAFALVTMAAGVTLTLSGEAPDAAAWFITGGLAVYVAGSEIIPNDPLPAFTRTLRTAVVPATVCLAFLRPVITTTGVVVLAAAWACGLAAYVTWRIPSRLKSVQADPLSYFRSARPAPPD